RHGSFRLTRRQGQPALADARAHLFMVAFEASALPDLEGRAGADEGGVGAYAGMLGEIGGQHDAALAVEGELPHVGQQGRERLALLRQLGQAVEAAAHLLDAVETGGFDGGQLDGAVGDDAGGTRFRQRGAEGSRNRNAALAVDFVEIGRKKNRHGLLPKRVPRAVASADVPELRARWARGSPLWD